MNAMTRTAFNSASFLSTIRGLGIPATVQTPEELHRFYAARLPRPQSRQVAAVVSGGNGNRNRPKPPAPALDASTARLAASALTRQHELNGVSLRLRELTEAANRA